ncbi:MAG TPA: GspE/PulE family protein [Phycisphaerales bacterium]|nr:GspE/PulE family protein [Phycisphaerales bacterium]
MDSKHFIVRTLVADGLVTETDIRRAGEAPLKPGENLLDALVSLGVISSRKLAIAKAKICEYPFVDLAQFDISIQNMKYLPRAVAERLAAFPLFVLDGTATVAMLDPLNLQAIDQIRQILKAEVDPVIADSDQLRALIARAYSLAQAESGFVSTAVVKEEALTTGEEPIVAAVNQIVSGAVDAGASDIHINPDENELILRYRVDGVLQTQQGPPKSSHVNIVQRLKVLAKLDLTQTRKPQDGKFRFTHRSGENVDIRLSLIPTIHGENVVMRLLRSAGKIGPVSGLGMPAEMTRWYEEAIERPHGMILVTGPTGSGKTTTLYTALNHLNSPSRNIITIEDPVEIRLPLIRQVQANAEVGLSFAAALRSVLRQDPDIVLVGEIRDQETAKIAVQAALTGHLVLSTLHTNDAVGALSRLKDFGVPMFAVNSALLCVIAQRLVRKLCEQCAQAENDQRILAMVPAALRQSPFKRGCGCGACRNTGYKGRLGAFEMFRMTPRVIKLVEQEATITEIQAAAMQDGMKLMWDDGLAKAARGLTSLSEVAKLHATGAEQEVRIAA